MKQIDEDDYSIKELINRCYINAELKGWHDTGISFSDAITLMHTELSEAFEEYRSGHGYSETYNVPDIYGFSKPEGIPIEFADLAIRLFHYCGFFGIDLVKAITLKMSYNETRPYRHGNKKA